MFLFLYVSVIMFILYYIYMPHMNSFTTLGWKSVSSLGFVILGAYLFSLAPAVSYRQYLLLGLLLGAIGDVFLALPYCYPKFEKQYFLGGLTAFLFWSSRIYCCFVSYYLAYYYPFGRNSNYGWLHNDWVVATTC